MNDDWASFEDRELIAAYRSAAAPAPAGYQARLRAQLRSTPLPPRTQRSFPGKRFTHLSVALGALICLIAVLSFWENRRSHTANAQTLLRQAVEAVPRQSYTGAMVVTTTTHFSGARRTVEGSTQRQIVQFAYRDLTHFRARVTTQQPAIDAGAEVLVANRTLTVYDGRSNSYTRTAGYAFTPFDLSDISPLSGEYYSLLSSVQEINTRLSQYTAHPPRIVGEGTVAGRATEIISAPLRTGGTIRAWIDRDHPFILEWRETKTRSLPSMHLITVYAMRITRIRYGDGPSSTALLFHPPAGATETHIGVCAPGCEPSTGNISSSWAANHFRGYYFVPPPSRLPSSDRTPEIVAHFDPFTGQLIGPGIVYSGSGADIISILPRWWPIFGFTQPYVYIQERIHTQGLPNALRAGTRHHVGSCTFWTATLINGTRTMALQRGKVSISVHTTALSADQFDAYGRSVLCRLR